MENEIKNKFFSAFETYFDADLIPDFDDQNAFDNAIEGVVDKLLPLTNSERNKFTNLLLGMLNDWNKEVVDKFIQETNFNWRTNDKTEHMLKEIVTKLSKSFRSYQIN